LCAGEDERDGVLYVASFTSVVHHTVELAKAILGENRASKAQFIDLGCGKGKALLVYCLMSNSAASPTALGIEYDARLADIAEGNLRICGLDDEAARVIRDTATHVTAYMHADAYIVYFYNAFRGSTLDRVLRDLDGLPHVLIYVDPVEQHILAKYGYTIHAQHDGPYHANTWLIASRNLIRADHGGLEDNIGTAS
jgi:16S rRNA G966 N2-methylase RsmD